MSTLKPRQKLLLGVLAVVALLVALDFAGLLGGPNAAEDDALDTGARAVYEQQARLALRRAALVENADTWQDALARARAEWEEARRTLVVATTPQLAVEKLRQRVRDVLDDAGARSPRIEERAGAAAADGPIRTITLQVTFDTRDPNAVYRVIDTLENLDDLRLHISEVSVRGPGVLRDVNRDLTATFVLHALASIEPEPADG